MRSLFQLHVIVVVIAAVVGLVVGSRFIEPTILGALLGLGAGLGGGAFTAAIATGTDLASRSAGGAGTPSIWDDEDVNNAPPTSNGSS